MNARLEIVSGVLRVYDAPPPAPFIASAVIVADEGTATVKALRAEHLPPAAYAAMRTALREAGFHTAIWHRRDPVSGEHRIIRAATGMKEGARTNAA